MNPDSPRVLCRRLQPRLCVHPTLLLIAHVKKTPYYDFRKIQFFFKTLNKSARPREHSGRPADMHRPDRLRRCDAVFVCVKEAAACGELRYMTYGPNMEHVSANMQTQQFAAK